MGEEEEERQLRREERKKAKGKSKAIYNPLGAAKPPKKVQFPPEAIPAASSSSTPMGPSSPMASIDPATMAKSTYVLAMRAHRREQKRLSRSVALRSTLRASTLRTEDNILEKQKALKENPNRKGRRAQHETGEIRTVRKMTQDELIAAALEEEESNKEALRDWVRREEEKRELRRVGRKRVVGPRWTWVSRTVGKLVEEVESPVEAVNTAKPPCPTQKSTPSDNVDKVATGEATSVTAEEPIEQLPLEKSEAAKPPDLGTSKGTSAESATW